MAMPAPPRPRWLIIVQRERHDLYRDLCRNVAPDGSVRIILDRRQTERRRETTRTEPDRRRRERRQGLSARDAELWAVAGLRLFYQDEDMQVYEVSAEASAVAEPRASFSPGRRAVLVIDDDRGVREIVSEFLDLLGLEPQGAATGAEGLALFESGVYDLVVTDLSMPGMTGWEVVEAVRRRVPGQAVIMMSGSASELDVGRARQQDVTLLRKPVGLEELKRAVELVIRSGPSRGL
jgi:CheY-like chemotaxis protein